MQFKNIFKKFKTCLMYFRYSAFQILLQIFLLLNFLSVICNLITVLIVSCFQAIVWVLLLITLKEYNNLKINWNKYNMSKIKQWWWSNGALFLQKLKRPVFFSHKVKFLWRLNCLLWNRKVYCWKRKTQIRKVVFWFFMYPSMILYTS